MLKEIRNNWNRLRINMQLNKNSISNVITN